MSQGWSRKMLLLIDLIDHCSDELREHLKNAPKMIMAHSLQRAGASDSDSDSSDENRSEGWWEKP